MAALVLLAGAVSLSPARAAEISKEAAAAAIEEEYAVRVLKVREAEVGGIPVWMVTVMQAGGDFNTAYQVQTLAVDRSTGKLVPSYRHGSSGLVESPSGAPTVRTETRPRAMHTGTWR